jgi:hypothetical protein
MLKEIMAIEGVELLSLTPASIKDFMTSFVHSEITTNDLNLMQACFTGV